MTYSLPYVLQGRRDGIRHTCFEVDDIPLWFSHSYLPSLLSFYRDSGPITSRIVKNDNLFLVPSVEVKPYIT